MASRKRGLWSRALAAVGLQRLPTATRNTDSYAGAQINRLMLDWIRAPLSADKELAAGRAQLVARSRDLCRNNGYGRRFVKMSQHHIVGADGIVLRAVNTMVNGRPLDSINDAVEAAWTRWSQPQYCTTNGRLSWIELQRLAVAEWKQAGEFLCQIVADASNPFGLSLHPIDADRLDDTLNVRAGTGQNEIRAGVELDRIGRAVAYHILTVHPSDVGLAKARSQYRERIPAADIVHVYQRDERAELSRGIPQMAVAMRDLRHLDQAQEAAIVALRAAAANPLFIETASPDGEVLAPDEDLYVSGDPGMATALGVGQHVAAPQMSQPRDTHPSLVKCFVRGIATGLGVSYNAIANDLEGVNMSSLRVGRHEEQETWKAEQSMMITQLCQPVFDRWIVSALLHGQISGAAYDVARVSRIQWHPRRWASVDPLKDVETHEKRVALGLDSRTQIVAAEGGDLWQTWDYLNEEAEYAEEIGIDIAPPRTTSSGQPDANTEAPTSAETAAPPEAGRALHMMRGAR